MKLTPSNPKPRSAVQAGLSTLFDNEQTGTTIKLYWRQQPTKGDLIIQLPPPKSIREDQRKELMDKLAGFIQTALPRPTAKGEIEVADVIVEISAQQLASFSKKDLDIFLERVEYFLSSWTFLPVEKGDIAIDYIE